MGSIVRYRWFLLLAAAMLLGFLWHGTKAFGTLASIFPDERTYSFGSRLQTMSEVSMPNYLYYAVYRVVGYFGEGYLDVARLLNAFFFTLGSLFIFLVARRFCEKNIAVAIAVLSLFAPSSLLVVFYLIDPLYYFVFWLLSWLFVRYGMAYRPATTLLCGAGLGVLTLVKVHGFFTFVGFMCYLLVYGLVEKDTRNAARIGKCLVAALLGFVIVKFGGGFVFAGMKGLTLFGYTYNRLTSIGATTIDLPGYIQGFFYNFIGQALGLFLLFGAPLVMAGHLAVAGEGEGRDRLPRQLAILFVCILVCLVAMSAAFSSLLDYSENYGGDLYHASRLQARYHFFLYPAYLMVAGCCLGRMKAAPGSLGKGGKVLVAVILAATVTATVSGFHGWVFLVMDFPELSSLIKPQYQNSILQILFCCLALVPFVLILVAPKKWPAVYLLIFMPLYTVCSVAIHQIPTLRYLERSGELGYSTFWLRDYLGEEAASLAIYDRYAKVGELLAFHLDRKEVHVFHGIKDGTVLGRDAIPPDTKWVLLHGKMRLEDGLSTYAMPLQGETQLEPGMVFALHRIAPYAFSVSVDETSPGWPVEAILRTDDEITLRYARDLPDRFRLSLVATGEKADLSPVTYSVRVRGRQRPYRVAATRDGSEWVEIQGESIGNAIYVRRTDGKALTPSAMSLRVEITPLD